MLAELKFVQGSVAKNDLVPFLTHFVIEKGTVRGYNGIIALSSPIPFDIECKPKATTLIKAISSCTETVQLALTGAGRLSVKSGKFKAFVDCIPDESTPHVKPEGDIVAIDGEAVLRAMKVIFPFIADSSAQPWSNGVLLLGQSAFATNNAVLVEYWTGSTVPRPINIPKSAIKELIRIDEAPESIQLADNSITFHFSGSRWLRTQLLDTKWPDVMKVLNRQSEPWPIDSRLFDALKVLKPFANKTGAVRFAGNGKLTTHESETEGASYDVDGFDNTGIYHIDMLNLLNGVATSVDWSAYPSPCMFFGEYLRGSIIGMKP